jgi:hypothetical protein
MAYVNPDGISQRELSCLSERYRAGIEEWIEGVGLKRLYQGCKLTTALLERNHANSVI